MRLTIKLEDADMANVGGIYFWTQSDYNALMSQLATIQMMLKQVLRQEMKEMSALDDLKAAVEQTQNVEQSAVTLIQGIAKQLSDALANNAAASNDPVLAQLRDQLNSSAAELAAAITSNTPQAPAEPPTEQPPSDQPSVNPQSRHR